MPPLPIRSSSYAQTESQNRTWTSSQQLEAILNVIADAFVLCDGDWRCISVNTAAEAVAGKDRSELIGANFWETFPPGSHSPHAEDMQLAMERHESCHFETLDDHTGRWYDVHCYPNADGLALLYHDVTEKHRAEELRREAEQRSSRVADAIPALLAHIDENLIYRYVNERLAETLGRPRSQIIGQPMREVLGDQAYEALLPYVEAALAGETVSYDMPLPLQGVGIRYLRATYVPHQNLTGEKQGFYALIQDVTEATEAQRKLNESERRLRFTLESANVGTWDWDLNTDVVEWSDNLEAIHGRPPGSFAGSFESVLEDIVPEDREHVLQAIAKALNERADYLVQYRVTRHDGTIIWVEGKGRAQYDDDGRPVRMVGICADITERKQSEEALQRSERELRLLNATLESRVEDRTRVLEETVRELESRNQELQHFAFAASHDLQEPLRKISTFCDILRIEYADRLDATGRHYIDRMESAARQMSTLLRGLLSFSLITTREQPFLTVDLDEILRDVLLDLEGHIKDTGARIEAGELGRIEGDPMQLRLLLQNLIDNAIKFHRRGVPPLIRIETALSPVPDSGPGKAECILTVQDNGIGFDMQHAERIFAPFQRLHTRQAYEGTGIGLALCTRIAERHRGSIKATSIPGQGSTFTVAFPVQG